MPASRDPSIFKAGKENFSKNMGAAADDVSEDRAW